MNKTNEYILAYISLHILANNKNPKIFNEIVETFNIYCYLNS